MVIGHSYSLSPRPAWTYRSLFRVSSPKRTYDAAFFIDLIGSYPVSQLLFRATISRRHKVPLCLDRLLLLVVCSRVSSIASVRQRCAHSWRRRRQLQVGRRLTSTSASETRSARWFWQRCRQWGFAQQPRPSADNLHPVALNGS